MTSTDVVVNRLGSRTRSEHAEKGADVVTSSTTGKTGTGQQG